MYCVYTFYTCKNAVYRLSGRWRTAAHRRTRQPGPHDAPDSINRDVITAVVSWDGWDPCGGGGGRWILLF